MCGSGCKERSPENLLEAPPLSGSQEGAPSRGWEVSGDPEALDLAALGPSGPVFGIPTQLSQSILTGGIALLLFTVDEDHVALMSKSGTQHLGILRS